MFKAFKKIAAALMVGAILITSSTTAMAATRKVTVTGTYAWTGSGVLYTEIKNANSVDATYSISVTKTFTNSFNANVSVSATVVNSAVGFSTSATYTVNETLNITAKAHYVTKLWIAPTGIRKALSIYDDYSTYCVTVGSGDAYQVQGKKYTINGYAI